MDPCHKPTTVNALAPSLLPHSALVVDAASSSSALGIQGDSSDIPPHASFDASESIHANDSAAPVWVYPIPWRCQC